MEELTKVDGVILAIVSTTVFRVELADKNQVLARVSENLRQQFIRMLPGDLVKLVLSRDGHGKASIVLRLSQG